MIKDKHFSVQLKSRLFNGWGGGEGDLEDGSHKLPVIRYTSTGDVTYNITAGNSAVSYTSKLCREDSLKSFTTGEKTF